MAVNDPAERCFGSMPGQLQCFGRIGLSHAGYIGQVCIHGFLSRGFDNNSKDKSVQMGILHKLTNKMRLFLIKSSLEDAQAILILERGNILKQRAAKHCK